MMQLDTNNVGVHGQDVNLGVSLGVGIVVGPPPSLLRLLRSPSGIWESYDFNYHLPSSWDSPFNKHSLLSQIQGVRVNVHCMRAPCLRISIVCACPAPFCTCPAHTCAQVLFARGCHASFACIDLSPRIIAYSLLGGCAQAPLIMWVHA